MSYKDKEKQREYDRERMRKVRQGRTGRVEQGRVEQTVTKDGTYFVDGVEMVPPFGKLPERPRYLKLSDGQVLDRAHPPKADFTLWPGWKIEALRWCNQADGMQPLRGSEALPSLKVRFNSAKKVT